MDILTLGALFISVLVCLGEGNWVAAIFAVVSLVLYWKLMIARLAIIKVMDQWRARR